jgi:hypothetical protein
MEHKGDGASGLPTTGAQDVHPPENGQHGAKGSNGLSDKISPELAHRLRELGRQVSPAEISEVWVFPPLSDLEGSTEFLLFTRFLGPELRRMCGAEFDSALNGNGQAKGAGNVPVANDNGASGEKSETGNGAAGSDGFPGRITEYGTVPTNRVSRLVAGLRRRLGDGRDPLYLDVGGSPAGWDQLVDEAAIAD